MRDGEKPIVMYFDECNVLHANSTKDGKTFYAALCHTLDALKGSIFGIFLSTKSSLSKFAPPKDHYPSTRMHGKHQDSRLLAPFTELPFDVHPDFPLRGVTLDELYTVPFMCRFGRPL
jgi:hypothetical protein